MDESVQHPWDVTPEEAAAIQKRLAPQVIRHNAFGEIRHVAGVDAGFPQDTAYFDWLPLGGIVGCWIALDPATVENGCMQVIPGTHLEGPVAHFHHRDCQIADERVQVHRAVAVPLAPGGVLFFSGLIHHGTPPNYSTDRRRALQFHYAAANCRNMTFEEHASLFSEGGLYAGCRGWGRSDIERAQYPTP